MPLPFSFPNEIEADIERSPLLNHFESSGEGVSRERGAMAEEEEKHPPGPRSMPIRRSPHTKWPHFPPSALFSFLQKEGNG